MLIHDKFYCEGYYDYDKFRNILNKLNKRQNVEFALHCAKDVFHLVKEREEVAKTCIDLVEKWLKDENSVTIKELNEATNVAIIPANSFNIAEVYAANVSSFASASAAASAAFNAAWGAVYATYAAGVSKFAAGVSKFNKFNEYLVIANSYLTTTNISCPNYEIEGKILYLIDELDENIFIKVEDKYYINMNEIENCPEYGFSSQQELLEELLYSEERFWAFVRNWLDQLYQ